MIRVEKLNPFDAMKKNFICSANLDDTRYFKVDIYKVIDLYCLNCLLRLAFFNGFDFLAIGVLIGFLIPSI
jgi:hypothetical protein